MAIYESTTQNYIKVDENKSFVQKNMIFVAHTVYATAQDRQREKERKPLFDMFDTKALQMIDQLSLSHQMEAAELLNWAVNQVKRNRYVSASSKEVAFPDEVYEILISCGYDPNWLIMPIHILTSRIVNCGRYNGEKITQEYLYHKLKEKMSNEIQNI